MSYSVPLIGSIGRSAGRGDFSSNSPSWSEPESYSESSPGSDSEEDSTGDGDSMADVPRELTEDARDSVDLAEIFSFFNKGSREGGHGPVPFSIKMLDLAFGEYCLKEYLGEGNVGSRFWTGDGCIWVQLLTWY